MKLSGADKYAVRWLMGREHVGESNVAIMRMMRPRVKHLDRKTRKEFYRYALLEHQKNRDLYNHVVHRTPMRYKA